jgi:hypothetical protein
MLFDVNGFKADEDVFGHPAGDAQLARLAGALKVAMVGRPAAYRLGGDEFCVRAAHGDGFSITASYRAILLPEESADSKEAMRLVDQRMYAQRSSGRRCADRQSKDVLLRTLYERNPDPGRPLRRRRRACRRGRGEAGPDHSGAPPAPPGRGAARHR